MNVLENRKIELEKYEVRTYEKKKKLCKMKIFECIQETGKIKMFFY